MIDLDHNATTRPSAAVLAALVEGAGELYHNPSSTHRAGQQARQAIELARQAMAELIGCKARDVTWTGSGSEAIDLAIRGVLGALPKPNRRLVTTKVEHHAVRAIAENAGSDFKVMDAPLLPDQSGRVDVEGLARLLGGAPGLVSVQWANNETGVVQPLGEVVRVAHERGWLVHTDATQWVGKVPTDLKTGPAVDVLTCAPHKFHGPKGVGVMMAARHVKVMPRVMGTQELGRRGGTENTAAIHASGVAAREAMEWLKDEGARVRGAALRDRLERALVERCGGVVNGGAVERLWNTTNVGFAGLEAEAILILLSERGVLASAGAACSSGSLDPSPVLVAMGVEPKVAHGSVRFSIGRETTEQEIDEAVEVIVDSVERLRGSWGAVRK
ncbi:MAG: cysteine desulfurase [Planctomycetes bacterium]|nr:cysteine desulfurase [Planctomycetota bacterium]